VYVAVELAAGFCVNSLVLLSDAWHNLTDVLGLGIAWLAVRQVRRPADQARTFGYHRPGILAALANAVLLAVVTRNLLLEAVWRLRRTSGLSADGDVILGVAAAIACVPWVKGVHHLHLWSLSGEVTALSCHVVVEDQQVSASGLLIERIRRELRERHGISHSTIQAEVAVPSAERPLPIHHKGAMIRT
jgi:Co/Zn/Cd efflux system component